MVLLGAGDGTRLGRGPKILTELRGRPLLDWALGWATTNTSVREIVVVGPPGLGDTVRDLVDRACAPVRIAVVDGGASRHDSVHRGLHAVSSALRNVITSTTHRDARHRGIIF